MKLSSLLLALASVLATPLALAQTAPTKPAASPAPKPAAAAPSPAEGKTLAIGGGNTTTGPVLSREELRACFSAEESIRVRLGEQDAVRPTLDKEKEAIAADQQALRAERAPIDDLKKQADELSAKLQQYGASVKSWEERLATHNLSNPNATGYDRRQAALNKERETIEKERTALEAERTRLAAAGTSVVESYNAKAQALDARVVAWNQRNGQWNEAIATLETERKSWVAGCANRRYREDDETAIRRGK